jgi:Fe2+ transport system protein A
VSIMPLSMIRPGESSLVKRVGGKEETKRFLENLGFVPGSSVTLISENAGNVIVHIRETRIAISKEMANKIMVA